MTRKGGRFHIGNAELKISMQKKGTDLFFYQQYFQGGIGTVDLNELEAWFQERPKWMQDAARRLV